MSPNKLVFDSIEFLSFEGGGAMGGAYLGALCAMQDIDTINGNCMFPGLKNKTEDNRTPDTGIGGIDYINGANQGVIKGVIQGVSGSSIGAIFGMCVAMGYTAEQINARLITDKVLTLLHEEKFTDKKRK